MSTAFFISGKSSIIFCNNLASFSLVILLAAPKQSRTTPVVQSLMNSTPEGATQNEQDG